MNYRLVGDRVVQHVNYGEFKNREGYTSKNYVDEYTDELDVLNAAFRKNIELYKLYSALLNFMPEEVRPIF